MSLNYNAIEECHVLKKYIQHPDQFYFGKDGHVYTQKTPTGFFRKLTRLFHYFVRLVYAKTSQEAQQELKKRVKHLFEKLPPELKQKHIEKPLDTLQFIIENYKPIVQVKRVAKPILAAARPQLAPLPVPEELKIAPRPASAPIPKPSPRAEGKRLITEIFQASEFFKIDILQWFRDQFEGSNSKDYQLGILNGLHEVFNSFNDRDLKGCFLKKLIEALIMDLSQKLGLFQLIKSPAVPELVFPKTADSRDLVKILNAQISPLLTIASKLPRDSSERIAARVYLNEIWKKTEKFQFQDQHVFETYRRFLAKQIGA